MAEREKPSEPAGLITLDQAGRLLGGLSAERIRQLIKEGYIPRAQPGRVLMVAAVQGYIKFLKELASKNTKTAADSEVRQERAREIRLRNDERMRTLIPIDDATAALDYLVGVVRSSMNSIPARVTRDIDLRRKIEAEVNAAQTQIAIALGKAADAARSGKEPPNPG